MGSHLDTQPTGGKFDGVLGVLGALEALRTLVQAGYETYAPIEVVNWTNEEGSRFAPAMLGSGVFGGAFARDWACAREDRAGVTFGDGARRRSAIAGRRACGDHPLSAFFELHIEQGPILEAEDKGDRRRHRRAGHALVRGHRHGPGRAYRRDADADAQECAARRRAPGRAHRCDRAAPCAARARRGRADGGPARILATWCRASVLLVDLRHPESAVLDGWKRDSRRALREICDPLGLGGDVDPHLGPAAGALRCRLRRLGARAPRTERVLRRARLFPAPATTRHMFRASRRPR